MSCSAESSDRSPVGVLTLIDGCSDSKSVVGKPDFKVLKVTSFMGKTILCHARACRGYCIRSMDSMMI